MPFIVQIAGLKFTFEGNEQAEPAKITDPVGNLYSIHFDRREGIRVTKDSGAKQLKIDTTTPIYSRSKIVAFDDKDCGYADEVNIK